MNHRVLSVMSSLLLIAALLLAACGPVAQDGVDDEFVPTPTTSATEPEPLPADPTPTVDVPEEEASDGDAPNGEAPLDYVTVDVPEAGLSFEVPGGWSRLDPDWRWVPEAGVSQQIGVIWAALEPPQEAEAVVLPSPSEVVSSEPVELAFGEGRRVVLNVFAPGTEESDEQAPVEAVEAHVLITVVQGGVRRAFSFFASAPDQAALAELEPMLEHMVASAALVAVEDAVVEAIRDQVAQALGVELESVRLDELVPTEWPDACLGLPADDEMCAMVITPGYSVVAVVDGESYNVRSNAEGTRIAMEDEMAEEPEAGVPETPASPEGPAAVSTARSMLARHLGIAEASISVVSYEYVEWPSACLGIEKPGQMCATVITPGYRVILSVDGRTYRVHTNQSGSSVGIVP